MSIGEKLQHAPPSSCCLTAGRVRWSELGNDEPALGISLVANGGPFRHPVWGQVAFDLAGMRRPSRVIFLWRGTIETKEKPVEPPEWEDKVIGFADRFQAAGTDLRIDGKLIPFRPKDSASEIIYRSRKGCPYEAQLRFDPGNGLRVEEVPEGMTTTANGQTINGPCLVLREWLLRGVEICVYANVFRASAVAGCA